MGRQLILAALVLTAVATSGCQVTDATKLLHHDMELPIDPSGVMPVAEQLVGKKAVFTGSLKRTTKTGLCLVADTLDPQ